MSESFNAATETSTSTPVPNAGGDNHINIAGSSGAWGSITSPSFLAGPKPGQEQTLIKVNNQTAMVQSGERIHDVQKNSTVNVTVGDNLQNYFKNRNTNVTLNDTINVMQSQFVNVNIDQNSKILGNQNTVVVKNKNTSITGKETRNIQGELALSVTKNITESGLLEVKITAGTKLVLAGPGGSITIDPSGVTIQGVIVKIN